MFLKSKVLKVIILISLVLVLLSSFFVFGGLNFTKQLQIEFLKSKNQHASSLVLVNRNSPSYTDFQSFLQPYLDHFGIPYDVLDISSQEVSPKIGTYALIIVGHREIDPDLLYLTAREQGFLTAAVKTGTGLVNFDNDLSTSNSFRYKFIQDIFGFEYTTEITGADVTFLPVNNFEGIMIDCTNDDHQDPVLTTITDPDLLSKLDNVWDEYLWGGYRSYAGVFGGTTEATKGDLEMVHFFGDVPNGEYRVFANLFHSRDWRYYWGYTPEDPRAYSIDVTSGPAGDFLEIELGTIKITNARFDLYTDHGEDLGGKSFPFFGWAWIRLVPIAEPPPGLHFITERHQINETISTEAMTMAGIRLPDGVVMLAKTVSQPFLAVTTYGLGNAVQWGTYDWMSYAIKGPLFGFDDLVWRSLVWAARKPFVLQGMPNFVTMRVDDVSGPFEWIEIANEFNIKPWAGLFYLDIDSTEANQLSSLVHDGNATASVHAKNEINFFYFDHEVGNLPEEIVTENFATATSWHQFYDIPISKFVLPHFYEFGSNVFQGLSNWEVEFVGAMMEPGSSYGAPWIINGPYRLHEVRSSNIAYPTFYADFITIPGHPEFTGKFFNCVTEIRDDAGYEWFPSNDITGSIGRGIHQTRRALDSMTIATLFTHGYYLQEITPENWRAILQGITADLLPYNPIYVTLDYACQYARALHTSNIKSSNYNPDEDMIRTDFTGQADIPTQFYLFTDQDGVINQVMVEVPEFNGSIEVVHPIN